jgi:hypothetical protein
MCSVKNRMSSYFSSVLYYFSGWVPGAGRNCQRNDVQYIKDNHAQLVLITQEMVSTRLAELKHVDQEQEAQRREQWFAPETLLDYMASHPKFTRWSGQKRQTNLYNIVAHEAQAPAGFQGEDEFAKKTHFLRWYGGHVRNRARVLKACTTFDASRLKSVGPVSPLPPSTRQSTHWTTPLSPVERRHSMG